MSAPSDYADGAGYGEERKTPCFADEKKWWIYVTAAGWMASGPLPPGMPLSEHVEEYFDRFEDACIFVGQQVDQEVGERRGAW